MLPENFGQADYRGLHCSGARGCGAEKLGDPGGSRTPNPQIRSLMLYPVELRGRAVNQFTPL